MKDWEQVIFRRTKSLVGLGIGSSAVKAVELRRMSSGYRVVTMGSEPLPPDCIVDASASTGSGLSYTWNFGDGDPTTVSNAMITHAFTDDGPRNVVLTVTDVEGNSASITQSITPPAP